MNTYARFRLTALASAFALLAFTSAAQAANGSLDLGAATLNGALTFESSHYEGGQGTGETITLDLDHVTAVNAVGRVGFAVDTALKHVYMGGWQPGAQYNVGGGVGLLTGFSIVGDAGQAIDWDSATVTVTGTVTVRDQGFLIFGSVADPTSPTFTSGSGVSVTSPFSITTLLKDATSSLYWSGNMAYHQGPNGTALANGSAEVSISRIEYSVGVSPVPEPSSISMGLMGLLAIGCCVARHRAA